MTDKLGLDTLTQNFGSQIGSEETKIRDMIKTMDPSNTQDMMKLNLEYSRYSMEEQAMAAFVADFRKMIENITQHM